MPLVNPYKRFLIILAICFIPFLAVRLGLYLVYYDDFDELSINQTIFAFLHGFRFDASTISLFIGLPLLLTLLPYRWSQSQLWQSFCLWLIFLALFINIFILASDFYYFDFVRRHVGPEIFVLLDDIALMVDMALSDYGWSLLLFAVGFVFAALLWRYFFLRPIDTRHHPLKRHVLLFVILLGFVIAGRGGLQYKPLSASDAFAAGSASAGYLTLNGSFAATQAIRRSKAKVRHFMPDAEAIEILQTYIADKEDVFLDSQYPLLRKNDKHNTEKPNIVFLVIESFDAIHFDRQRQLNGLKSFGSTPNLDKLSKQGMLFTNFYATGQRSMDGLAATLASMPTLPGLPYIGKGLEQNRLSFLGNLARSQGYETLFLQSSNRGSFHIDSIAAQSGFDQYFGAEDIPRMHEKSNQASEWGVWDYDTFSFANKLFTKSKKPFIGYIFTSTTHTPWRIPNERWQLHSPENDRSKYLNSLFYVDWAVNELINKAKAGGYYDNTVFIITGDHISRFAVDTQKLTSRFHIPLLMFGPGIPQGVINDSIGNQMDILPSIIDIANWQVNHSSVGKSLFIEDSPRFSFSVNGDVINYIDDKLWLSHNLTNTIYEKALDDQADISEARKKLLATYQATFKLTLENKIYK